MQLISVVLMLTLVGSVQMQALGQAGLGALLGGLGLGGLQGLGGGLTNGLLPMQNGMAPSNMMSQGMNMGQSSLQGLTQTLSALLNGVSQGQMGPQGMAMNQQMGQQDIAQTLSRLSRSSLELLQRVIDSIARSLPNDQFRQQQLPGPINNQPFGG